MAHPGHPSALDTADRSRFPGAPTLPVGTDPERFWCGLPAGPWHMVVRAPRHTGWPDQPYCSGCGAWFDDDPQASGHVAAHQFVRSGTPRVIEIDRHADSRFERVA